VSTMKCNACGSLVPTDSRFCPHCGVSTVVPTLSPKQPEKPSLRWAFDKAAFAFDELKSKFHVQTRNKKVVIVVFCITIAFVFLYSTGMFNSSDVWASTGFCSDATNREVRRLAEDSPNFKTNNIRVLDVYARLDSGHDRPGSRCSAQLVTNGGQYLILFRIDDDSGYRTLSGRISRL
jgi:hypothetical protein